MTIDTINHRIRTVRRALGLTQMEFARGISVSHGYIARIETTQNKTVSDRVVRLIGLTYGVSEAWLKRGEGKMFQRLPKTSDNPAIDDIQCELYSIFQSLSPKYQKYIISQMKQLNELQNEEEAGVSGKRKKSRK